MATHLVNLDALIQREDFESGDVVSATGEPLFKLEELDRQRMYFKTLRKPDFQRQTADWSPEMIVGLVKSFLDGEVIPALILWHSKTTGKIFDRWLASTQRTHRLGERRLRRWGYFP